MTILLRLLAIGVLACVVACRRAERPALTVAAAANLTGAFDQIGAAFTQKTGIRVVYSYGATAQLAQQIENAAPFDVFAAADTEHVDALIRDGRVARESRAIYARGRLALWAPRGSVRNLEDLTGPAIRFIAIANPETAPYGEAAVESLKSVGLWDRLQKKIVYANNINMAKQFAATGNADAAFTAYSLVLKDPGVILVDEKLHRPLDQAIGIVSASSRKADAQRFLSFVTAGEGRSTLARFGYQISIRSGASGQTRSPLGRARS